MKQLSAEQIQNNWKKLIDTINKNAIKHILKVFLNNVK